MSDEKASENGSLELQQTITTKNQAEHIEIIRTISRVENPNYHEKNGLRTEGDGVDHEHYNPRSVSFIMTIVGCSLALAGSQIVPLLYLTLGTTIAYELGAPDLLIWMLTAGIVAQGALAPFIGPLADLVGRKHLFIIGLIVSALGAILCAATPNVGGFIAGQVFLGFGIVTEELLALAVVTEIVPTAKRPLYTAMNLIAIIPWAPGTLYANWIAISSWRWIGCTLAIWNVITLVIVAWFYRPPPRVNSLGLSRKQMLARIDFTGGFLLTTGLVLLLVGINSGGRNFPWHSAAVITFLTVGLVFIVLFGLWEQFGATYPMYPKRIIHAPRPFFCMLFVIFAAGINYVPLVVFWPIQSISVYQSGHFETGVNTLPIGICILSGAILSAVLLGLFNKHVTLIMTLFCIMQTVASGCLTAVDPHKVSSAIAPIVLALIGVGGVLIPNQVIITVITPDDLIGSVTALTVGLRSQAQVIGLSLFYSRLVTEVTKNALKDIVPPILAAGVYDAKVIIALVTSLTAVPFKDYVVRIPQLADPVHFAAVQEAAIQCFSQSFKSVYFITIAFGIPACIAASMMGDVSKFMDNHVAVVL